jgi:hypothetical protein
MDRNGRASIPGHDLFSGLFYVARKPARQITTSAAITLFGAARQFRACPPQCDDNPIYTGAEAIL